MKLNRAILSANDNPKYLDFWPYVSKAWRDLIGVEPVLFFIGEASRVLELSQYGQVIQVPEDPLWDIVNQAQSIRLWAGTKFPDDTIIMSDLDMLPISKKYYMEHLPEIPDNFFVSYTSDVLEHGFYRRRPMLPMCYLAGKGSTFNEILDINENTSWEYFMLKMKQANYGHGTDQQYFYAQFLKWQHKTNRYVGLRRGWIDGKIARNRLDKVRWPENDNYTTEEMFDCHLPLPMKDNFQRCQTLFKKLNLL